MTDDFREQLEKNRLCSDLVLTQVIMQIEIIKWTPPYQE